MNLFTGQIRKFAGNRFISHTAAVHNRDVYIQPHLIKEIIKRIRTEIAGIRRLFANQAVSVCIIVIEHNFTVSDHFSQAGINFRNPCVFQCFHFCVRRNPGKFFPGKQLRGNLSACRDGHLTDRVQIRTCLCKNYTASVFCCNDLLLHGCMGMTVNKRIKSGRIGDYINTSPWLRRRIYAKMSETDHIIGSGFPCRINGALHRLIQCRSIISACNLINIIAICILEIDRRRRGKCFRRRNTNKCDFHS